MKTPPRIWATAQRAEGPRLPGKPGRSLALWAPVLLPRLPQDVPDKKLRISQNLVPSQDLAIEQRCGAVFLVSDAHSGFLLDAVWFSITEQPKTVICSLLQRYSAGLRPFGVDLDHTACREEEMKQGDETGLEGKGT